MAQRARAVVALVLAAVAALFALGPAPASASIRASAEPSRHIVVVGVPGLRWSDIREKGTPNLWRLTAQGGAATMTDKTIAGYTCPIDGWLTVSAGQRSELRNGNCGLPAAPADGAHAPGFGRMREDNAQGKYDAKPGLLGDTVHGAGGCTMAIGPGAVYGAADRNGRVDGYAPSLDRAPPDGWSRCALTMVDVDDVFRAYINAGVDVEGRQAQISAKQRTGAARRADAQIGRVLSAVPPGTTVLIAGVADNSKSPHLHTAIATGPGYSPRHYLTAESTRAEGLVTLTDVTATALKVMGLPKPSDAVGSPWRTGAAQPATTGDTVRALDDKDVAAQTYADINPWFYGILVALQVTLYVVATVALRRKRPGLLRASRVLALAVAALLPSAFLANLIPWWSSAHPAPTLAAAIGVAMLVITAVAARGPWGRSVTLGGALIGGLTALVLTVDVLTGNHLQTCSMLGYTPIVAGRFYGFGNPSWALWVTGVIIVVGAVAGWLLHLGRRRAAVIFVVVSGAVALVINAAPIMGADFGGLIALVPGFTVFTFMIAERKVAPARLALILAAGAVLILGIAFADSLRANPTHIGEFWDSLTSGDAGTIILRKARGMIGTFGRSPYLVFMAVGALAFLFFVLYRPLAVRATALETAYTHAPGLRATLAAVLVTAGVGMLVNDSGIGIPALAFSEAIPLALAACARALRIDAPDPPPGQPAPSESAPASTE